MYKMYKNIKLKYILDDVRISKVAKHSLVCYVGIKSLKLTDFHLCDGQTCWG